MEARSFPYDRGKMGWAAAAAAVAARADQDADGTAAPAAVPTPPRDAREAAVRDAMAAALGLEGAAAAAGVCCERGDFFELGGTSVTAVANQYHGGQGDIGYT